MKSGGKRKLSTVGAPSDIQPPSYEHATGSENENTPLISTSEKQNGDDKDLVSAAEALTQLTQLNSNVNSSSTSLNSRLSTPPMISTANGAHNGGSSVSSPVISNFLIEKQTVLPPIQKQHPLVERVNKVSRHPLVTNAVKYYDYSKRNYASFNYAAEFVEKAAIPVVNKIEVNLNNRYQAKKAKQEARKGTSKKRRKVNQHYATSAASSPSLSPSLPPAPAPSFASSASFSSSGRSSLTYSDTNVSIETKKRLQFCLHILKLANEKINNLVLVLQQRVVTKEIEAKEKREAISAGDVKQDEAQRTNIEIVTTVKNIIRLISNFKPSSLATKDEQNESAIDEKDGITPVNSHTNSVGSRKNSTDDDQLKGTIRDIILALPATIQQSSSGNTQTNDRVLVFAKESLDMISRLTVVFNNQLEKAEAWVAGEQQEQENQQIEKRSILTEKVIGEELDSGSTSESTTDGENTLSGFGCR